MLLATMYKISGYNKQKIVKVYFDNHNYFELNLLPIGITSNVGYIEPIK